MEYVQQVSVQIAAASMAEAKALADELEAHRTSLRGQRGFVRMNISRSVEDDGNTLISAETRWRDNNSLADYTTYDDNAANIMQKYSAVMVLGSLSVRRMEAVDSAPEASTAVYERFATALLVPAAVVGGGLAVIYSLSRVYLEVGNEGATAIAAGIAIAILAAAWYFANTPKVPQWQFAAVGMAAVALLLGGTIYAQVSEGPEFHLAASVAGDHGGEEPGLPVGPTAEPGAPAPVIMDDNVFIVNGEENPTITAAAGTEVVLQLDNVGSAVHNIHIDQGGFEVAICKTGASPDAPCSDPASIRGGAQGTITFTLPAGTYDYRCDFHVQDMKGTLEVQ